MIVSLVLLSIALLQFFTMEIGGSFTMKRLDLTTWSAEYCFDLPVKAVRFNRPFKDLRIYAWRVNNDKFELIHIDGSAIIQRRDGTSFDCTALKLQQYTELPEANYFAFSSFSDGGVSVYTGYLIGEVLVDGDWHGTDMKAKYIGRRNEKVLTNEPNYLTEQFVYYGSGDLLETDGIIAVVDPSLPPDITENITATISAVQSLLTDEFHFHQKEPYMVFIATDFDAFEGYSIKGGALPNQILFTLRGEEIVSMLRNNPGYLSKLTAHEVIHLWQNEHWFGKLGKDHPWVHEGSAEALAIEILYRIGLYNDEQYEKIWNSTELECMEYLQKTSIHSAPENNMFDAVYPCGAMVNRLLGEALNPDEQGEGLISLWKKMAGREESVRKKMASEKLLFQTLENAGFSKKQIDSLQKFLIMKSDESNEMIANLRRKLQF